MSEAVPTTGSRWNFARVIQLSLGVTECNLEEQLLGGHCQVCTKEGFWHASERKRHYLSGTFPRIATFTPRCYFYLLISGNNGLWNRGTNWFFTTWCPSSLFKAVSFLVAWSSTCSLLARVGGTFLPSFRLTWTSGVDEPFFFVGKNDKARWSGTLQVSTRCVHHYWLSARLHDY